MHFPIPLFSVQIPIYKWINVRLSKQVKYIFVDVSENIINPGG